MSQLASFMACQMPFRLGFPSLVLRGFVGCLRGGGHHGQGQKSRSGGSNQQPASQPTPLLPTEFAPWQSPLNPPRSGYTIPALIVHSNTYEVKVVLKQSCEHLLWAIRAVSTNNPFQIHPASSQPKTSDLKLRTRFAAWRLLPPQPPGASSTGARPIISAARAVWLSFRPIR